jgi:hypothetical protein
MDLSELRRISILRAQAMGTSVPVHLPLLDEPRPSMDQEAAISRLLAMTAIAAAAYGFPESRAVAWTESVGATGSFTKAERRFLDSGAGSKRPFQEQIEGMWALAWALNIVPDLQPAEPCSANFVRLLPDLKAGESADKLRGQAHLRPIDELMEAADLSYLLHWGLREAALRGMPSAPDIDEYVVAERRRALEWLLYGGAWEEVSLDT